MFTYILFYFRYDGVTADPRNLAKFVGALVEKHTSTSSLKATCRKQLTEFLGDCRLLW